MSGDDLSPATDDHCIDVALYQYVAVPVGHRHRVVVGPVSDQREGTHPARLLLTGIVGHRGQRHQRASRSRSIRCPMVSVWPRSLAPIRSRQRRSRKAFKASKLSKDGMGTRKLRRT